MRVIHRVRCPHAIKNCFYQAPAFTVTVVRTCQRYAYILLGAMFFMLFVWWSTLDSSECDGPEVVEHVCQVYNEKYTTGNLCHELCVTKQLDLHSCYSYKDDLKRYRVDDIIFKVVDNPNLVFKEERIEEGLTSAEFLQQVKDLLLYELGHPNTDLLLKQLVLDFDINQDGKINLGEAQNMWWVLIQPNFLNFYIFQDSVSIPHLNGTCGGISVWYYLYLMEGTSLYRKTTPWPISIFTSNFYRWTLPHWSLRAKVMLSLVELVEEMYEKDGVRYHLCNVNGLSLYHHSSYEVAITDDTMLLSSQQIHNRLSNITCHYAHDCILTPQCQTSCEFSSRQCTDRIIRPTIAVVCDVMIDYLLFDTPKEIKVSLNRAITRCQSISVYTQQLDLVHSLLILDLKSILWNYIQNKLK
uniref:FAM69 N-terminal domain-containing protein n=1 Tax=Arion vulgaris TaxID=1028688 RepID=A0A0B6Y0H3_9EUPU